MQFAVAVAALAGVAAAGHTAGNSTVAAPSDVYVTETLTAFTTYCPEATKITQGGKTYTVTEATSLTITDCPGGCTVTKPVSSAVVSSCTTCDSSAPVAPVTSSEAEATTTPVAPVYGSSSSAPVASVPASSAPEVNPTIPAVPYPSANGTVPVAPVGSGTAAPSGTGAASTSTGSTAPYTGAASKQYFSAGAGFLALFGLVAAL